MKFLSYITLFLYLGYCHGVNTRRKLTRLHQDVESLRDLAVDLRQDIDDLYTWRNDTFAASHDTSVWVRAEERDTGNNIEASRYVDSLIRSFERSLNVMDRRVSYVIQGLTGEKMALRDMIKDITAEVRQEIGMIQIRVDNAIQDTDETRRLAESTKEALRALFSNHSDRLAILDRRLAVRLNICESECREVSKNLESAVRHVDEKMNKQDLATKTSIDEIRSELKRIAELQHGMSMKLDGWLRHDGFFYKLFTTKATFSTSVKRCESLDGSLVIAPDLAELAFHNDNFGGEYFWLGASDRQTEGVWRWVNGQLMKGDNWATGQPDNYRNNEDCLMAGGRFGSTLNDYPCSVKISYVCKRQ